MLLVTTDHGSGGRRCEFYTFVGRWKMVVDTYNDVLQLFDLKIDPTEALNLAGKSDTKDEVERPKHEMLTFRLRTDDRQFREVNG